jgi:hypothetical protein
MLSKKMVKNSGVISFGFSSNDLKRAPESIQVFFIEVAIDTEKTANNFF